MKIQYRILTGQQVLAEGVGLEMGKIKDVGRVVMAAERNFEKATGYRLHLSIFEDHFVTPAVETAESETAEPEFVGEVMAPVVLIESPLHSVVNELKSPELTIHDATFAGGESGGAGASADYDPPMSDSGSLPDNTSSYDSSSGSGGSSE